jgi:molybdate transport system ATP-binding protein
MVEGPVNDAGLEAHLVVTRGNSFRLDLTLSIPAGTTAALLGPNGSGKSTAVAALAGLLPLEKGRIRLAGFDLDDPTQSLFVPPEARRIGVVFQDYLLFPHLNVIENIAFGLRSRRVGKDVSLARSAHWMERLGLGGLARRRPGDLSGGQAQRVALARALVTEPDLLLLDEPLSALDVTTRIQFRRTLAEHLEGFAGPRMLITHDPTEAFLLADEIHVIEHGTLTQVGTSDDIRLRPLTSYVADLAGSNLIAGTANDGVIDTGAHVLHIADHSVSGPVLATIRPSAISLHLREPDGSPRNAWQTTVDLIEHLGDRTRLRTGNPLPLTAEITEEATRALDLVAGASVWVSIKATEITVEPDLPEAITGEAL